MENHESKDQTTTAPNADYQWKGPARYRIVVGKRLSLDWSGRLAGMEIMPGNEARSQAPVTRLEGILRDQAELSGVLNALYDTGFPLLSVEILDE
jgi:hypothetical protein